MGSRKLIFQTGVPANIDVLLGKDGSTDKTRISVIYLNTLHTTEEKEFFIAGIAQLLYRWMLKNPLDSGQEGIQCAMFIDEIAPYIPPVKVPACKANLELLFRQGRKYGVSCLIATQSPGDIDYKAIGQFSTFILGTLNTKQDIDKVKKRLESVAPKEIDFIITQLPALKPGNFLVASPDEFDRVQQMKVRWLVTDHRVLPENQLGKINAKDLIDFYKKSEHSIEEPAIVHEKRKVLGEQLLVVTNKVIERDIRKIIRPHLAGILFKSEELVSSLFQYKPLIKVEITWVEKTGIFRKKKIEIPENLYLDFNTEKLIYVENKRFKSAYVVDSDPHKIKDLDNYCTIEEKNKDDVDFDYRLLGGRKLKKNKIKKLMERKYGVVVNRVAMVLFPTWACTIKNKKENKTRELLLEGVFGKSFNI